MRYLIVAMLLAGTAAVPAAAQRMQNERGAMGARAEARSESRGTGGGWVGRSERSERAAPAQQATPAPAPVRQPRGDGGGRNWRGNNGGGAAVATPAPQPRGDGGNWRGRRGNDGNGAVVAQPVPAPQGTNRTWRGNRGNDTMVTGNNGTDRRSGNWRGRDDDNDRNRDRNWRGSNNGGLAAGVMGRGNNDRRWDGDNDRRYDRDRDGRRDGNWGNGNNRRYDWNRGWRNDNRYNWYSYRNQYRSHYRAPRYYNPYGYGYNYNRFSIGVYLDSLFYGSRYWLDDPWSYRLPPAHGPYRWVRYYDDVLLVDLRSGEVVDVIYDFFW